jgi:predicted nucleic acid-binding protein
MDKVVVDSSVWVDFFNKKKSNEIDIIKHWIENQPLVSCIYVLAVIYQEVLQGIKEDKFYDLVKEVIQGFNFPDFNMYEAAENAAAIFRKLQRKGITIRKQNDCLIAAICIILDYKIMHKDRDFDNIAKYTSLKIYK